MLTTAPMVAVTFERGCYRTFRNGAPYEMEARPATGLHGELPDGRALDVPGGALTVEVTLIGILLMGRLPLVEVGHHQPQHAALSAGARSAEACEAGQRGRPPPAPFMHHAAGAQVGEQAARHDGSHGGVKASIVGLVEELAQLRLGDDPFVASYMGPMATTTRSPTRRYRHGRPGAIDWWTSFPLRAAGSRRPGSRRSRPARGHPWRPGGAARPAGASQPAGGLGQRLHTLIPLGTARWKKLYCQCGAVERENGQRQNEWALLPLRVRRLNTPAALAPLKEQRPWVASGDRPGGPLLAGDPAS